MRDGNTAYLLGACWGLSSASGLGFKLSLDGSGIALSPSVAQCPHLNRDGISWPV